HALRRALDEAERLCEQARAEWEPMAIEAERWWGRAAVLAGERTLDLALHDVEGPATVRLAWRNTLGVEHPVDPRVRLPPAPAFPPGGSVAVVYAAQAHGRALEAAAELGAAQLIRERTAAELARTTQRLRALERRWIPEHERALHDLELTLDEGDREEAARTRWAIRRIRATN
ncbi:MAG: V-type ATP synthase subunit D, partial [Gaiellaceae bacterium]